MTLIEAMDSRISRRKYTNEVLGPDEISKLNSRVEELNSKYKLKIQLVTGDNKAIGKFSKSYGMFSGVQNYFAMIGSPQTENFWELVGYTGEDLVLLSTAMGLGTCWIGGTFDKDSCNVVLNGDEEIVCIISVGKTPKDQTFKEKMVRKMIHRSSKTIEEMLTSDKDVPSWITTGMEAVQKAPSAVNKQPVKFLYMNGFLTAQVNDIKTMQAVDLGIAKYHFSLAVGGEFEFGNSGRFSIN